MKIGAVLRKQNASFLRCLCISLLVFTFPLMGFAQSIRLVTEHYPPYNIDLTLEEKNSRNGIGGASTEIVIEMIRRSKYPYTLDLLPWKRAYGMAKKSRLWVSFRQQEQAHEKSYSSGLVL